MKVKVKGLVVRKGRYYWEPNRLERAAGWKPLGFARDLDAAIKGANARNAEIEDWRAGGARPREVRRFAARATVDHLIERFTAERLPKLAASTQALYAYNLRKISEWAGPEAVTSITPRRIRALRDAMMKPVPCGECQPCRGKRPCEAPRVRHTMAFNLLSQLRALLKFAVELELITTNPAAAHGLGKPPPRDQIWSPEAREALLAEAAKPIAIDMGTWTDMAPAETSIGLALQLGFALGQREADLLHMTIGQYVEIAPHKMDPEVHAALAALAPDGTVRGIRIRQRKTRRWIEVPIIGDVRAAVEANVARARAAGLTTILFDDRTARPFTDVNERGRANGLGRFQRRFAQLRDLAIATARKAGNAELATELAELEFRDLRRTAVVYLGELGLPDHLISAITGHDLDETKRILEVYMPRTTGMAARAIALSHARAAQPTRLTGTASDG